MVHRGNTREPKRIRNVRMSTLADKLRRHKNKRRIWRRCVARLTLIRFEQITYGAASLEAAPYLVFRKDVCVRSFVPPIPALGASIERSERRTGIRYPASEYRLETSTISLFSEENNRHDIPFENIGSISDMFHEQLPLPVPCS